MVTSCACCAVAGCLRVRSRHESSKLEKLQADGMRNCVGSWLAVQDSVETSAKLVSHTVFHSSFCARAQKMCVYTVNPVWFNQAY